ncbi:conserved protein of unknown function [Rhodovastum atsumiense]|uniref:Uncharacterized protein n=1 Tax=Rhodovastum atsumiense TaxID=504468 RepID=A0A5M6IRW5_9PROT|nr:hypothetical protein [Rhodovastum atsumiense]KAA5611022.1 hypothetical protein F1189_16560 [Rhodovastum atsumiense]CAH2600194.1 conserved protein of unknown function [Rhodovastum atsumiense]
MITMALQGSGSQPLPTAATFAAMAQALCEKTSDVVARVVAIDADLAERAASASVLHPLPDTDALPIEDGDDIADETDDRATRIVREPSGRAMLQALGIAASLLLTWVGMQIV